MVPPGAGVAGAASLAGGVAGVVGAIGSTAGACSLTAGGLAVDDVVVGSVVGPPI